MTTIKITDLPNLGNAISSSDVFVVDDVSELVTKQVSVGDLQGYLASFAIGYTGSTGSNFYNDPVLKTSNYVAVNRDLIIADTSGGSFTIDLPSSPVLGTRVKLLDGSDWAINSLLISRNGSTIEGDAEDFSLNIKGAIVEFYFDSTTWQLFTNVGQKGSSGITVSATEPTSPEINDLWLDIS